MILKNHSVSTSVFHPLIDHTLQYTDIKEIFGKTNIAGSENITTINSLSEECRNLFNSLGSRKIEENYFQNNQICISLEGDDIKKAILFEAYDFFLKAISNFFAQYEIVKKGFITWAQISNYYCSFFSINALIRLQGKVLTRIWNNNLFYIFIDINNKEFYLKKIDQRGSNHKLIWKKFYSIYDKFEFNDLRYEPAYKKSYLDNDFDDEVEFRNTKNYKVYQGFTEFWNVTNISLLIREYENYNTINYNVVDHLNSLSTDPIFKYYARAALRIVFLMKIFADLSSAKLFNEKNIKKNINDFYETYLKNSIINDSTIFKVKEEMQNI